VTVTSENISPEQSGSAIAPADGPARRDTLRRRLTRAGAIGAGGIAACVVGLAVASTTPGPVGLGAAAVGLACLGFGGVVFVRTCGERVRALLGIADALETYAGGEASRDALRLEASGGFAAGWNRLVSDRMDAMDGERAAAFDRRSTPGAVKGDALDGVLDALWQGLLVVDESMHVVHANGAAGVMLGVPPREAVGLRLGGADLPLEVAASIEGVVEGRRSRDTVEWTRGEPGSETVLRVSSKRVRRDDRGEAIVLSEDVTQQKVAEEARHAMLGQTVHELRSPLTTIRLHVEEAIEEGQEDVDLLASALDVVNRETRRLERVVSEMLSVAEMESGSFEVHRSDVRLDAVFGELESDYTAQSQSKNVSLSFELPPKWPVAVADREKLMVALHNLVGNAVKYTPSGGSVDVRVQADDRSLTVEVEDTGIGIRPEDRERVFERFFRAGDGRVAAITGSGLGLATAREIARRHGGDITLRSELDEGSVFTLRVPIAPGGVGSAGGDAADAPRARAA